MNFFVYLESGHRTTVKTDRLDLIHIARSNRVQSEKNGQEIEGGELKRDVWIVLSTSVTLGWFSPSGQEPECWTINELWNEKLPVFWPKWLKLTIPARHIFRLTKKCYGLASSLLNQQFGAAVILMTAPLVVDVANHQYFSVGNCFKSLGWNS